MKPTPLAAMLGCIFATSAFSSPIFENPTFSINAWAPLLVAQSEVSTLSDSDLRRIGFYANRTVTAMIAFDTADDETTLQALRTSIGRLIEAGEKSGLSTLNIADYFQQYVAQNGLDTIPEHLLTPAGQVETRDLFQETEAFLAQATPVSVDIDAINNADLMGIQSIITQQPESEPQLQTPSQTLALPEIAPDADPEIRAILERVMVQDGQWVIEVARGDSLGEYAEAIYNDQQLFSLIFDANSPVLLSPNVLPVGAILILPRVE